MSTTQKRVCPDDRAGGSRIETRIVTWPLWAHPA